MMSKLQITSTSKLKSDLYSVLFSDGILLNIRYKPGATSGTSEHMCSVGTDSYFMRKGHFPKGQNLRKRLLLGIDTVKSRQNRYKTKNTALSAA